MSIGSKLAGLRMALLQQAKVPSEHLKCFMESCTLEPTSSDQGKGLTLAHVQYVASFDIEHYHGEPNLLLAIVSAWLIDHDCERFEKQLPDPVFEIEARANDIADISINVVFSEQVHVVPDQHGPVLFDGERWALSEVPIDTITQAYLGDNHDLPLEPVVE